MPSLGRRRIGLVIGQLSFGGAESQLYELAKNLRKTDDVVVYCLSDRVEPYGDRLAAAGVPVRSIPSRGSFDFSRARRLAAMLRTDRIEIVHAFLFIASAYAYLATRGATGCALVTSARNCKAEANPLKRTLMRRAFRASHAVICNSRVMRDYAVSHYHAPAARSHVVYNGVDSERFAAACTDGRIVDRAGVVGNAERQAELPFTAGTVGRIEAQKNLSMFIEVAIKVCAVRPQSRFAVVGEGSLRSEMENRAQAAGVGEAIEFRGVTADMPGFLAGLRQFWLTSDWEGTPNVVLEAMAAGVPVIATDAGATAELVKDGETGFVVACGDARVFAERSLRLLNDPDLATRMAVAAAQCVRRDFSIARMVEATRHVYALALEFSGCE